MRKLLAVLAPVALVLSGCSSMPLPGGAGAGGYAVTIEFADVLDLVANSAVKVNDVTVGNVEDIEAEGWTAKVTVRVDEDVKLPANATAALRQTSLLGEKFIALSPPIDVPPAGDLTDGATIPLERTRRSAEVEEVLGALALTLGGGGLDQLRTINTELIAALEGRESDIRDTLNQLDVFVTALDAQRDDIVAAIEALDGLAAELAAQKDDIGAALEALGPGAEVLADQRENLTSALSALGELGRVGTHVVNATREDTLATVRSLQPVLEQLVKAGDDFPRGLELALSYPFPHNVSGAIKGDFVNLHVTLDLDLGNVLSNLFGAEPEPTPVPGKPAGEKDPVTGAIDPLVGGLTDLLLGGLAK
ncbi:ABC transporter substrate-binding protein [Actinorhabdospora filicis]|uniref:ABC transporter substrate-binding protein n=1 Tax=Actinorhabdospora filicis TaxID=1785913 RepID=A0A9W6SJ03_9ACTN|nr:MCE family protein [Actinorhabdospora filicis]GLZ76842.1 ABC transporter substrate-binding protein [Actinorhabdospora filicis]